MYAINYTDARQNFAKIMDKASIDHVPVIVTRQKSEPIIMMSLADYNSIIETNYLLSTPKNTQYLMESLKQYQKDDIIPVTIEQLDALAAD